MRKPDPPFPSFTLMMNQCNNDSMRLPSYRESLVVRYHPYPRRQSKTADRLMQRVDYRYEEALPAQDEQGTQNAAERAVSDAVEEVALELNRAASEDEVGGVKRRRSLTTLIIDLAFAVRRGYRVSRFGKKPPTPKDD